MPTMGPLVAAIALPVTSVIQTGLLLARPVPVQESAQSALLMGTITIGSLKHAISARLATTVMRTSMV